MVYLCNVSDPQAVRATMVFLVDSFHGGAVAIDGAAGQLAALTNIILLASLLREHIEAGNWP